MSMGDGRTAVTEKKWRGLAFGAAAVAAILALSGCGSSARTAYRQAEAAAEREMWDTAVLSYAKAVALEPGELKFKAGLQRAKLRAAAAHFDRAKRYLESDQWELALQELQATVTLDPSNQYARVELKKVREELDRRASGPSPMDRAKIEAARRAQDLGPPKLDPASNIPIVLKLPDTTIGEAYDTISKASGINFLYDDKVDLKKKTSVELANVTFEKAMDILMLMNKHFFKVIDSHTILVADDTRQKRQEYEDNVIRTFYLSNAETKDVTTLLRSLLETRRISDNQDLNAITIKDTPEKIKVAERIIKSNDKAKGEVIVDIELLEITRNRQTKIGLDLSAKTLTLAFGDGKQSLTLNNLSAFKSKAAWSIGPVPSVTMDFLKSDADSKSIAKPQIRILEGESAKVTIGDRVPIPATTFNTSQTIGTSIVPVTSFTYQNVGIIIDMKPRVHHNKEITLEVKLEISSLAGSVEGTGGVSQPIIGTRSVETTIRLGDGETNLIGGLVKEDEQTSLSGVPGLTDLPVLQRLFGKTTKSANNTDIVLSITPHIIRVPNVEPIDLVPLWVGTEDQVKLRGVARNALGESPFASDRPWDEIERELLGDNAPLPEEQAKPAGGEKSEQIKLKSTGGADKGGKEGKAEPSRPGSAGRKPQGVQSGTGPAGKLPRGKKPPVPVTPPPPPATGEEASPPAEGNEEPAEPPVPGEEPEEGGEAEGEEEAEPDATPKQPKKPATTAQVRLAPEKPRVKTGEGVAVELYVTGAENVGTVNLQLRYNKDVLRFVPPASLGDFLAQGGAPADLQAVESADGGMIVIAVTRAGSAGASGSGRLVRLEFVALQAGSASFGFSSAQVRDPDSQSLPASFRVSSVEVEP